MKRKNGNGITLNVVYQPQIELRTGKIVGAEALVRPTGREGRIDTQKYIAALETDGGIEKLDCFVFTQACKDLRELLKEFPAFKFSGNASRRTLESVEFTERFSEIAAAYEIPPSAVVAEITESYLEVDVGRINRTVRKLRERGFTVSIDDFGKGCSCLSFLSEIDCDGIKLDKCFLRQFDNPKTRVIVDWTLELAERLGLQTLAEGIETAEQADYLRARSCLLGQGYYYARPMTAEELKEKLRNQSLHRGER